jgi:hypothetical protein
MTPVRLYEEAAGVRLRLPEGAAPQQEADGLAA